MLSDIEAMELVRIETDPADRRANLVTLTDRGHEFDEAVGDVVARIEQELEARISRRSVDALWRALEAEWGEPMVAETAASPVCDSEAYSTS